MADITNDSNYVFLDGIMSGIDWSKVDYALDHARERDTISELIWTMQGVVHDEPNGREIVNALMDRYWRGHDMEKHIPVIFPAPSHVAVNEVIPEWLVAAASAAGKDGNEWMAYNGSMYFIEKGDVFFFPSKEEAEAFASDNVSDADHFSVRHISYINELATMLANEKQINFLSFENQETMNKENFEYLANNVKYMGFGEKLADELKSNIERGNSEFHLNFKTEFNKKDFEATLHFRKSDSTDMYFFNSYRATLERTNGEKIDQLFYINKGHGVTAKEAFNLLDGRAVHKELETKGGEKYTAWMQLDFENKDKHQNYEVKQYHENFGYNLKDAVGRLPVVEMDGGDKEKQLLHSLEKGNIQAVNFDVDGRKEQMYIEANPAYKSIHVYDSDMKRVVKEDLAKYRKAEQPAENVQQSKGKDDKKKAVKSEKAESLLPKKKVKQGKGLGV